MMICVKLMLNIPSEDFENFNNLDPDQWISEQAPKGEGTAEDLILYPGDTTVVRDDLGEFAKFHLKGDCLKVGIVDRNKEKS